MAYRSSVAMSNLSYLQTFDARCEVNVKPNAQVEATTNKRLQAAAKILPRTGSACQLFLDMSLMTIERAANRATEGTCGVSCSIQRKAVDTQISLAAETQKTE